MRTVTDIFARADSADLADAVRRLLRDLDRTHGAGASIGECRPPIDVYETADAIEVALDVPGVGPDDVRVVVRENAVIVVGEKAAGSCAAKDARFHLAERTFGRFARALRLLTPVDAAKARAELSKGRLRIIVPRIDDRRGRDIPVKVVRVS
jgi:HSP20 family protein